MTCRPPLKATDNFQAHAVVRIRNKFLCALAALFSMLGQPAFAEAKHDAASHTTQIKVPAQAPDVKDTVIALEYETVQADPKAKGKYLWSKSTGVQHNRN